MLHFTYSNHIQTRYYSKA